MIQTKSSSFITTFCLLLQQEWLLARRRYLDWLNPVWLLMLISILFAFATTPDNKQLQLFATGIIWLAVLFATILSLEQLFREDFNDGTLEQWLLSHQPLPGLILAKVLAHWCLTCVPILLLVPLLGLLFHLSWHSIGVLWLTLLLGTPSLTLLGAIGAALTVGLRQAGILLSLLILPLAVPVLIFGAAASSLAESGIAIVGQLAWLGSLLLFTVCLAPLAIATALRIGNS